MGLVHPVSLFLQPGYQASADEGAMKMTIRTTIEVSGAKQNNLKNISVEIPRDKLTVITGVSG